ncbi:hypothetical protein Pfo_008755 [Paulownia fortunei]|nr:hypothetical protein Pfo_008755 [Paulownia fortunei]
MSDSEVDSNSGAPEEFTSQQVRTIISYETNFIYWKFSGNYSSFFSSAFSRDATRRRDKRSPEKKKKARVVCEGKERHTQWEDPSKDETETETHEEAKDNKEMLPDDGAKLLAACEKKVLTSDYEDQKAEKKPASRKRRPKKSGSEPVILKDTPSSQCAQNSLDFLEKRKMQVSRISAVLNNSNQALRLILSVLNEILGMVSLLYVIAAGFSIFNHCLRNIGCFLKQLLLFFLMVTSASTQFAIVR